MAKQATLEYLMDYPTWLDPADKGAASVIRNAHRDAATHAMEDFKKHRLPGRFTGQLAGHLGFDQRKPGYERRKAKRGKRGKTHNWTGRSFSIARNAPVKVTGRAEKGAVKIPIRGLPAGYRRGFTSYGGINLRAELEHISSAELTRFARLYQKRFIRFLKTDPKAVRRRRKFI